jgi:hypothetical protein
LSDPVTGPHPPEQAEGRELQNPAGAAETMVAAEVSGLTLGAFAWEKIRLADGVLNGAASRFWKHPELPRLFPKFLRELYLLVSSSVPLMRAGLQRAEELAPRDTLAALTAEYLTRHIEDEKDHDLWLLEDMVAAGFDRQAVLNMTPGANVASLIGAQYFWIHQAHPAAIFGYLAAVEGNPPLSQHLEEIQVHTGYPREAFRCLHEHAERDAEHMEELKGVMQQLPLTTDTASLITVSGFATIAGLARILDDLVETEARD